MATEEEAGAIGARYRAYCDACESGQLDKLPAFWAIPCMFTVDDGAADAESMIIASKDELIKLYSTLFGPSTGVDKTMIDASEIVFYGDRLATIKTKLRHLAKGVLHDRQEAIYGCKKVAGEWMFISHLSMDIKERLA